MQVHELYPQIAERDELEGCTANWLIKLHEHAAEFLEWEKAPLNDFSRAHAHVRLPWSV